MLEIKDLITLSINPSIQGATLKQNEIQALGISQVELLSLSNDMVRLGTSSHIESLNPVVREELGLQLLHMTQSDPELQKDYRALKNKYLSIGKSFSSITYLFDLVEVDFTILDLLLMHELLIGEGSYRDKEVTIQQAGGDEIVISADKLELKLEEIFAWYNLHQQNNSVSKIVLATLFHYYLVKLHPFFDGNGRLSRLFMNLIILKGGFFPIVVPNGIRLEYYKSLMKADTGDFSSLVDLVANLVSEKASEYLKLAEGMSLLKCEIDCLVLTEDGNTGLVTEILNIHGFDLSKVAVESYEGKDNIAAAAFLAKKMMEHDSNIKHIIFHRDRDNENPQKLKQIISRLVRGQGLEAFSTVFITRNYDMESYFINKKHISELFPLIGEQRASELIEDATKMASEISKQKLRIAYSVAGKFVKILDPEEQAKEINDLYDSDPEKYRYGKEVLRNLVLLIEDELGISSVDLVKKSSCINIPEFTKVRDLLCH